MNDSLLLLNYTVRRIARIGGIAVPVALFALSLPAQDGEAVLGATPFGFQCGMTADQVAGLVGKNALKEVPDDVPAALREQGFRSLKIATAPQPHPAFGSYALIVSPQQGVAEIIARDFKARGDASLYNTYVEIRAAVSGIYGTAETFASPKAGGGRSWDAFWNLGSASPNQVHMIGLSAEQADDISILGAAPTDYKSNLAAKDSLALSYECFGFEGDVASKRTERAAAVPRTPATPWPHGGVSPAQEFAAKLDPTVLGQTPFGFKCGMTVEEVIGLVGKGAIHDSHGDVLKLSTAPRPSPLFDSYRLFVSPRRGVLRIDGRNSNELPVDELNQAFSYLHDNLTVMYGDSKFTDL